MGERHAAEVARRGWELYERAITPRVEPDHVGRFVVVDVDSGRYVAADSELAAFRRARDEAPDGTFYLVRVGHRAAHRLASHRSPSVRVSVTSAGVERMSPLTRRGAAPPPR